MKRLELAKKLYEQALKVGHKRKLFDEICALYTSDRRQSHNYLKDYIMNVLTIPDKHVYKQLILFEHGNEVLTYITKFVTTVDDILKLNKSDFILYACEKAHLCYNEEIAEKLCTLGYQQQNYVYDAIKYGQKYGDPNETLGNYILGNGSPSDVCDFFSNGWNDEARYKHQYNEDIVTAILRGIRDRPRASSHYDDAIRAAMRYSEMFKRFSYQLYLETEKDRSLQLEYRKDVIEKNMFSVNDLKEDIKRDELTCFAEKLNWVKYEYILEKFCAKYPNKSGAKVMRIIKKQRTVGVGEFEIEL